MRLDAEKAALEIRNIRLDTGLAISCISIEAPNAGYDADSRRLELSPEASMVAEIEADAIRKFASALDVEGVRELQVTLGQGSVKVTGRAQSVFSIPFEAVGTLEIEDGTLIVFRPTHVHAAGIGLPGTMIEALLERINPLVDLSPLPFPIRLSDIKLSEAGVRIEALISSIQL